MAASARPSEADISSGAAPDARTPRMPPRVRKVVTVVHVISSVGWIGLTLPAAAASIFELRARFHEAASLVAQHPTGPVSAMHMGALRATLVVAPTVALCVYVANVILSIFKPWGRRA